jgi:cell division protein FtsL
MKVFANCCIWVLFFGLMVGNIYVFVSGLTLSDQIHTFEKEISNLHQQNSDLETKVYNMESITYAASLAAELDYNKKTEPVFFGEHAYAYKQ